MCCVVLTSITNNKAANGFGFRSKIEKLLSPVVVRGSLFSGQVNKQRDNNAQRHWNCWWPSCKCNRIPMNEADWYLYRANAVYVVPQAYTS